MEHIKRFFLCLTKDPERKVTDGGPYLTCPISISLKCLAQMIFLSTEIEKS